MEKKEDVKNNIKLIEVMQQQHKKKIKKKIDFVFYCSPFEFLFQSFSFFQRFECEINKKKLNNAMSQNLYPKKEMRRTKKNVKQNIRLILNGKIRIHFIELDVG